MENGESSYRRFLDGDKEAFREIIELYRRGLLFFVNNYVHCLTEAEDIVEDSFVELVVHPHRYNFSVSLKTYLFAIARYKAINYLRRQTRRGEISLEQSGWFSDSETLWSFFEKEKNQALYQEMSGLKADYRTALYLYYFENMRYEEMGRVMRKNRKQIENLLRRGREALRSELEKKGVYSYDEE